METKGISCKIPVELHQWITDEIRADGSTMSKFIEMIIEHYYETKEKGTETMSKTRTMAFQISEELFQKIKEYLAEYERVYHRRLTQKEFVIGLVEQALEEAPEEFEAAREAQASHFSPDSPLLHRQSDADEEESGEDDVGSEEIEDADDVSTDPEDAEGDDEDGDDADETDPEDDEDEGDPAE